MNTNIFKPGDLVCAKVNPTVKLEVRIYARRVYYCIVSNDPEKKERIFFERELQSFK